MIMVLFIGMFHKLYKNYDSSLKVTPIASLSPGFVNIVGIVRKPFQQSRLTKVKTHYMAYSLAL